MPASAWHSCRDAALFPNYFIVVVVVLLHSGFEVKYNANRVAYRVTKKMPRGGTMTKCEMFHCVTKGLPNNRQWHDDKGLGSWVVGRTRAGGNVKTDWEKTEIEHDRWVMLWVSGMITGLGPPRTDYDRPDVLHNEDAEFWMHVA